MAHMARVYAALFVWRKGELGIDEQQGPEDIAPNWRIPAAASPATASRRVRHP